MISGDLARALGVSREAHPQLVAEHLIRQAGGEIIERQIYPLAADWLCRVAGELGAYLSRWNATPLTESLDTIARRVARETGPQLSPPVAPSVLAAIAPHHVIGPCTAQELPQKCRAAVRGELFSFCRKVLDTWQRDRHLLVREVDDDWVA